MYTGYLQLVVGIQAINMHLIDMSGESHNFSLHVLFIIPLYRVIQSSSIVLEEVLRDIIYSRKYEYIFYRFTTISELTFLR
jgi:hypothetical protein